MPRTAQRGLLLRKIIYIIELLLLGTKNEISSDSSSMVLEITYDLLELYQEISRRRYTVPRTISAGRHHVTNDVLENLIKAYPEPAFMIAGWLCGVEDIAGWLCGVEDIAGWLCGVEDIACEFWRNLSLSRTLGIEVFG
ncbi:hypothetical protein L211DRAFT_832904 [Terfezia boudieri ATCC MYA-4762]|uniref:Uncharacterized protein n=1 Tax=Terfezia boudieri ATCC MYA-4762 TaxID=1051890 RepID=A0A3N4M9J4_9PEZI|nr:hypothetical protein L211DRAFT_832904 [Terfezia boudieri ATCC MYA-4762]